MSTVVQISEAVSLAFHGMGLLAGPEERMSVKDMAAATGASEAHLAKVFQRLVKEGLVVSTRGPRGGFALARAPEEITLFQIYLAMEGVPRENACLLRRTECPFGSCLFGGLLGDLTRQFVGYLQEKTLADLRGRT
jgi:Rrf2 family protein